MFEAQKQRPHELLWMLWFDEKSISSTIHMCIWVHFSMAEKKYCSSSFWLKVTIDGWWSRVPVTWTEDTNSTLETSPRTSWMFDSLIIRRQPQKIVDDNFQGGGSIFNIMVAIDSYIIVLFDQWHCHFYSLVLHYMEMKFQKRGTM